MIRKVGNQMKVRENSEEKTVDFGRLNPGDCFRWNDELYIKSDFNQNAVGLNDGHALTDMCGDMVTPVNAEVQILG